MQAVVFLSVLLFIGGSYALPAEYAEPKHRWTLIPDGDGRMHLMDLNPIEPIEPVEPSFNADNDVFFVLFTRRNPTAGQRLARTTASINGSQWRSTAGGTRFIIHGWNNNPLSPVNTMITQAYLAAADHNVVRVDWGAGANSLSYPTSRNRVPDVARVTASFIDWLHQNGFLVNFNRLVIAGHSLGGHIAGITGKRVTRGRIQAIFALDPAGPLFSVGDANGRFASGDGVYTEMIATNAGVLGFAEPLGQATFYPNWGTSQPGCGTDISGNCAHGRVNNFYSESVTSNRFVARRCANHGQITSRNCPTGQGTGTMGGNGSKNLNGVFFLETNANSPFARG
ncbi:CLUMA_CG002968, isoform A [Clunio marinus]|uniref:CLUMA_CG002968, isoform A n=1 Tax=Clunio marinus TaxID=568069 RepID=A0A1J1HMB4_9DIPT|nr:CLUMA_CG002968, isoform A [Clunio marinus]